MRTVPVNFAGLVRADRARLENGADEVAAFAGYVVEDTSARPRALLWTWGYVLAVPNLSANHSAIERIAARAQRLDPYSGHGVRVAGQTGAVHPIEAQPLIPVPVKTLRPVASGECYRITSPPAQGLARPELAGALEAVFESFAQSQGFTAARPLEINFARGFAAGSPGHGEGRAIDIGAVGGKGLAKWKDEWDRAMEAAAGLSDSKAKEEAVAAETQCNLGHGLYTALLAHGGWRADGEGWRPYRGVTQLFGPWTASDGPWRPMQIANPTPYQRQRLADQQWVFRAHQDHIHVAR